MKKKRQFKRTIELGQKKPTSQTFQRPSQPSSSTSLFDETVKFRHLGLHQLICQSCEKNGYLNPTFIQRRAIPEALKGHDIIGVSKTGSGKTAAFILPILQFLLTQKMKVSPCSALVIAPSRELALQLERHFQMLGNDIGLKTMSLIGGIEFETQVVLLEKNNPHVVVGTPGRLNYFLENYRKFNLHRCKFLVIDECDLMLGIKFKKDLDSILKFFKSSVKNVRKYIYTATMTKKIWKLRKLYLSQNAVKIDCSEGNRYNTVETLEQKFLLIPEKYKEVYLNYVLNELAGKRILIFVGQNVECLTLTIMLRSVGFPVVPLTSLMNEEHRISCLKKFDSGDYPIIISTDLSARGLDIPKIDVVLNFEIPQNSKDYIHRIGRTARIGKDGLSLTFVTQYDIEYFQRIEKLIGKKMEEFPTKKDDVMTLCNTVFKAMKMAKNKIKYNEGDDGLSGLRKEDDVEDRIISDAIGNLKRKRDGEKKRKKKRRKMKR